jgi:hypothetical protein
MSPWPFKQTDPVQKFWQWFSQNRIRLHGLSPGNLNLFHDLNKRLKKINPGLVAEFAMAENKAVELVVSADGDLKLFPVVERVVAAAPHIPGWKITAFRQPGKTDVAIEMNGQQLSASDLRFRSEPDGNKLGLIIFIPGLTEQNRETLSRMAFILLDNALGEYLVETAIGFIDFLSLDKDPKAAETLSFIQLHQHVHQTVKPGK